MTATAAPPMRAATLIMSEPAAFSPPADVGDSVAEVSVIVDDIIVVDVDEGIIDDDDDIMDDDDIADDDDIIEDVDMAEDEPIDDEAIDDEAIDEVGAEGAEVEPLEPPPERQSVLHDRRQPCPVRYRDHDVRGALEDRDLA